MKLGDYFEEFSEFLSELRGAMTKWESEKDSYDAEMKTQFVEYFIEFRVKFLYLIDLSCYFETIKMHDGAKLDTSNLEQFRDWLCELEI